MDKGAKQSGTEVREKSTETWSDPVCIGVIADRQFGSEGNKCNIQVKHIKPPVV